MKGWSPFHQERKVIGREGETYVRDKYIFKDELSDEPMYKGHLPSTHLMSYGSTGKGENLKYHAYPTLFQNEDGSWYTGSHEKKEGTVNAFEEAKRKGELYNFDTEEEAKAFAEGSWKDKHFNK